MKYIVPIEYEVDAETSDKAIERMQTTIQLAIDALGQSEQATTLAGGYYSEPYTL